MKHNLAAGICVLAVLLSVPAAATAQGAPRCSYPMVSGEWGYTKTGTLYTPGGPALFASLGIFTLDSGGNVSGTLEARVNGAVEKSWLSGTFTVESNCTGTMTAGVYDQSGALLRTIYMSLVFDDQAQELRGLVRALVVANGPILPAVITGAAKRVFPNREIER
jgi:hypothetical protein